MKNHILFQHTFSCGKLSEIVSLFSFVCVVDANFNYRSEIIFPTKLMKRIPNGLFGSVKGLLVKE